MANEAHYEILTNGVKAWNEWRRGKPHVRPDLAGATLKRTKLAGIDFSNVNLHEAQLGAADLRKADFTAANVEFANLVGANLSGAKLWKARLYYSRLNDANLKGADFREANLSHAQLNGVLFHEANLTQANLSAADLHNTDFHHCKFRDTVLVGLDLSMANGLDTVEHRGPSYVGLDTIYLSKGTIPETFLRGAGVPDNFIDFMHSLVGTGIEYYSCFISYSSKDQQFAERLYADLQANGVRCWYAPHHGQAGRKLHVQIDEAIRLHEKLLLILSADSIRSEWVKTEIKKAAKRQTEETKDVLFPVSLVAFKELRQWECFDSDLGKDLAAEIREYLIPDFSQWKDHDSYQTSFAKLLKDLQLGKTKASAAGL